MMPEAQLIGVEGHQLGRARRIAQAQRAPVVRQENAGPALLHLPDQDRQGGGQFRRAITSSNQDLRGFRHQGQD